MDDASASTLNEIARLRKQISIPSGQQGASDDEGQLISAQSVPMTASLGNSEIPQEQLRGSQQAASYAKPMPTRMAVPMSFGKREAPMPSVSQVKESAIVNPSVPDVSVAQELSDFGVETTAPEIAKIPPDLSQIVQPSGPLTQVMTEPTKTVELPKRPFAGLRGIPDAISVQISNKEPNDIIKTLELIQKGKGGRDSGKFLTALIARGFKKKFAQEANIVPTANNEDIMGQ